jgi:hypothetical protein
LEEWASKGELPPPAHAQPAAQPSAQQAGHTPRTGPPRQESTVAVKGHRWQASGGDGVLHSEEKVSMSYLAGKSSHGIYCEALYCTASTVRPAPPIRRRKNRAGASLLDERLIILPHPDFTANAERITLFMYKNQVRTQLTHRCTVDNGLRHTRLQHRLSCETRHSPELKKAPALLRAYDPFRCG